MLKYRPEWCPTCKYYTPQKGASSPKCQNKNEVFIGESRIKCYAYKQTGQTDLIALIITDCPDNTVEGWEDKVDIPTGATCHYERDTDGQWWVRWGGDFPGDKPGRIKCEASVFMEIAYQQGLVEALLCPGIVAEED